METSFNKTLRVLLWPVVVIAGVNLETWAAKTGYGSLLTSSIDPDSALGITLDFFTDPLVTHITAFVAGGIVLAWLGYWFELLEYRHGGPPYWLLKSQIEGARDCLKKGRKKHGGLTVEEHCTRANKALNHFGLFEVDSDHALRVNIREEYVIYLTSAHALLNGKHFDAAKDVSSRHEAKIKALIDGPQVSSIPPTPIG